MVVVDGNNLTGVGSQRVDFPRKDGPDNCFFELGFLFSELGFVGIIGVGIREIGGVEKDVFEGLGEKRGGGSRTDLESSQQGLEEEIVEVCGVAEGAHRPKVKRGGGCGFRVLEGRR